MVGPAAKRAAVAHLQAVMSLSERRACSIVGADRKMIRYRSSRPPDATLRGRLRDLANERRRFGYRRLFVLLRREGEPSGIYRLYREEGLTVRKRRARRKAVGTRAPILVEAMPNARWPLDFVHNQFANGRRFRILNIVDDVTKECLGAIPDKSISGRRVARELTAVVERRGKPAMIVSDHGTEFTCNAMLAWCRDAAIDWHFIAPGKPMQNAFIESFMYRRIWTPPDCNDRLDQDRRPQLLTYIRLLDAAGQRLRREPRWFSPASTSTAPRHRRKPCRSTHQVREATG